MPSGDLACQGHAPYPGDGRAAHGCGSRYGICRPGKHRLRLHRLHLEPGHVSDSIVATVIRGLLAPFGHGLWTGIVGAVLFRESQLDRFRFNRPVMLTFLFVTLLHGLWDGLPRTIFLIVPPGVPVSLVTVILSILGLVAFFLLFRQALRRRADLIQSTGV